VGINLDEQREEAQQFRQRHLLSYPVLLDRGHKLYRDLRRGDLVDALIPADVVATPYHVILDRQGVVRHRGMLFNEETFRRIIEKLL